MKRSAFLLTILVVVQSHLVLSQKQNGFEQILDATKNFEIEQRYNLIENFLKVNSTPVVQDSTCYFVYLGQAQSVRVAGDFNSWDSEDTEFTKVDGSNIWYLKEQFPETARMDYKLIVDGNSMLDPLNPVRIGGGFGENSELRMPKYQQPWEIEPLPGVSQGKVDTLTISSKKTKGKYQTMVYTPVGYNATKKYPTVYFQDGQDYIKLGNAITVINNLIASNRIQPVIAVFVQPNNRNEEYAFDKRFKYRDFFVEELVPYIDERYSAIKDPKSRLVLGDSYGGNISAIISFTRPDVFGNCGLHSGAFQEYNFDTNNIVKEAKKDVKVASVWGTYEGSLPDNMRMIRDHLKENDYEIYWKEYPEGHSWGLWRATLDDLLHYFFPLY